MRGERLWIVLDNYGLPRFADEECEKLRYFLDYKDALACATEIAKDNPNTIITIFERVCAVWDNGSWIEVSDETQHKLAKP